MIKRHDDLNKLCPGIDTVGGKTCGFEPGEAACQLARLNFRPELFVDDISASVAQPYACGFGTGNRDCWKARRRFSEKYQVKA